MTTTQPPIPDVPIYMGPDPAQPNALRAEDRAAKQHLAKEVGERIRERRKELGLSQADLAALLGRNNRNWLSDVENGRKILSAPLLDEVAQQLETTTDYLLRGSTPR